MKTTREPVQCTRELMCRHRHVKRNSLHFLGCGKTQMTQRKPMKTTECQYGESGGTKGHH